MITCGIVGVQPRKVWTVTEKKTPATLRVTLPIAGTDDSGGCFGSAYAVFQPKDVFRLLDVRLVEGDPTSAGEAKPLELNDLVDVAFVQVRHDILVRFRRRAALVTPGEVITVMLENAGRASRTIVVEVVGEWVEVVDAKFEEVQP
jgi:hypothetical protein